MLRVLLVLAAVLISFEALACQTGIPLSTEEARRASNVFVFRVTSIRADDTREFVAVGTLQVLANVRGRTTATMLEYSTGWCGGISLDPGVDYIGFLPSDARVLQASPDTVVPLLFGRYDRGVADRLERVLRGKTSLEEAFGQSWDLSRRIPPPPPPPHPEPAGRP